MKKLILLSLVAVFLFTAPIAFAWEKGAFGFLYKVDPVGRLWYDPYSIFPDNFNPGKRHNIGAVYNFSPRVALKTSLLLSFLMGNYEDENDVELGQYSAFIFGTQVEVPISLLNVNKLDFYIAPAFRSGWSIVNVEIPMGTTVQENSFYEYVGLVNFGGQFMITKNFAIFGEWGVAFAYTIVDDHLPDPTEQARGWAIHTDQAGIGIIFYL